MEKRSFINQVTVRRDGSVVIETVKEIVDADGETILAQERRSDVMLPDEDVETAIAEVNRQLADSKGFPPVEVKELKEILAKAEAGAKRLA
jgi:hypothetical protein